LLDNLDIARCRVTTTELAVLSWGRMAELVDGSDTDFVEGLHLAAAMQYYRTALDASCPELCGCESE